jgi:DNA gyrase inhibitor GyrI
MRPMHVKIVTLPAMRVISAHGFGSQPEDQAWKKMEEWARPKGLLDDPAGQRMFGYNNPNPSAGSPNYGYEFCLTVGADVEPEGDLREKQLSGGKYAEATFDGPVAGPESEDFVPAQWGRLNTWVAENGYRHGEQQWLEEHTLDGQCITLLYPLA